MTRPLKHFLQDVVRRVGKFPVVRDAKTAIESASERAQLNLSTIQNVSVDKYNTVVKHINGATIIQDQNGLTLQKPAPIPERLLKWWRFYQQLTGLENVEMAQQHMFAVQEKLFKCQNDRRALSNQASLVAEKVRENYGELLQTRRDDPRYVQLTMIENKTLREQTRIGTQLHLLEDEERDLFTQLATAIKEYHDSQAMNAQKYKYLSIVASAALAIVSLCGSMIYNNRRIRDVRQVIADAQQKNETTFQECFGSLEKSMVGKLDTIHKQLRVNQKEHSVTGIFEEKEAKPMSEPSNNAMYILIGSIAVLLGKWLFT